MTILNRYTIEIESMEKGTFRYWEDRARASHNGHTGQLRASSRVGYASIDFLTGPLAGNSVRIPFVQLMDEYNKRG